MLYVRAIEACLYKLQWKVSWLRELTLEVDTLRCRDRRTNRAIFQQRVVVMTWLRGIDPPEIGLPDTSKRQEPLNLSEGLGLRKGRTRIYILLGGRC